MNRYFLDYYGSLQPPPFMLLLSVLLPFKYPSPHQWGLKFHKPPVGSIDLVQYMFLQIL